MPFATAPHRRQPARSALCRWRTSSRGRLRPGFAPILRSAWLPGLFAGLHAQADQGFRPPRRAARPRLSGVAGACRARDPRGDGRRRHRRAQPQDRLAGVAHLPQVVDHPETLARLSQEPDAPKPSMWQRIKAAVAPSMADTVIDRYVTPENLPVLLGYRRIYRGTVQPAIGPKEPPTVLAGTLLSGGATSTVSQASGPGSAAQPSSRPPASCSRWRTSHRPERRYVGTLELRGWEWKLTGLTVAGAGL